MSQCSIEPKDGRIQDLSSRERRSIHDLIILYMADRDPGAEAFREHGVHVPGHRVHLRNTRISIGIGAERLEGYCGVLRSTLGPMERLVQLSQSCGGGLSQPEIDLGPAGDESGIHELIAQDTAQQDIAIGEVVGVSRVGVSRDPYRLEITILSQGENAEGTESLRGGACGRIQSVGPDDVGWVRVEEPACGYSAEQKRNCRGKQPGAELYQIHCYSLPVRSQGSLARPSSGPEAARRSR